EFNTKFNPGSRFGGDYFDIFEHEDKLKFGILISSASGYGLSSVLLAVIIKISSQIEARRGLPPHQVLKTLAEEVIPQIKNQDHASLFYAVVDRRNFEMEYSSVGKIIGYHQVSGQERLEELKGSIRPLGAGFVDDIVSHKVQLNPRDRFILVTEGVAESQTADGKTWGEDGLISAIRTAPKLGVHELRNEILYMNELATGKKTPLRDQTIIVGEVKDRVIKLARK
ncbi:MAG: PP2C family protein-serine/threonine phosphatase, partial [Bdellovibrionia bacterium]